MKEELGPHEFQEQSLIITCTSPLLESSNPCSDTGPLNMSVLPNFSVSNEELIDQICGDLSPEPESMDKQEMTLMDKLESNSQRNTQTLEISVFPFSTLSNEQISTHFGNIMHHEQIRRMKMKISKLQQKQNSVLRDQIVKIVLFSTLQLQKEKDVCLQIEKELKETIGDLEKKCEVQQKTIRRNINIDKQDNEIMKLKMVKLTEEIAKLSENNKENEIEITKLKARNSLLQCFSELHFHNFSKASDEKKSLQSEYDKLQETVKTMKSEVQKEIEELKQKCITDVNEIRHKNNMLLKDIEKLQQKCKAHKTIINNITKKSKVIKEESEQKHKMEIKKLNSKLLKANATIDNLQSENKLKEMTKEIEELKQKCKEQQEALTKKNKKYEQESEKYKSEIVKLNAKLAEANTIIENYQEEEMREFQDRHHVGGDSSIVYIPKQLPPKYNELQERNHPDADLQNEINYLNQKCQALQKEICIKSWKIIAQNEDKEKEIAILKDKITTLDYFCAFDLQNEIDELKRKRKKHEQTISKKSLKILEQKNTHQSEVEKFRREIDQLKQKCQGKTSKIVK